MKRTLVYAPPATANAMAALRRKFPDLPAEYLHLLERSNGAEGDLAVEPGWFVIWAAEEAVNATLAYGLPLYLPGHFAFGSNGGGELFVFAPPRNSTVERGVFMVPAVGAAPSELRLVALNFAEFERQMGIARRNEA